MSHQRLPQNIVASVFWTMNNAEWYGTGNDRHKCSFIELAVLSGHITGGMCLPHGGSLRTQGSAFHAALAAFCKVAGCLCDGIPHPWTLTFGLAHKIRSDRRPEVHDVPGICAGPNNPLWEVAQRRTDLDIAAAANSGTNWRCVAPSFGTRYMLWSASPEENALAISSALVQDAAVNRAGGLRITNRRQPYAMPKPKTKQARVGPCHFGCLWTSRRGAGFVPRWECPSNIPQQRLPLARSSARNVMIGSQREDASNSGLAGDGRTVRMNIWMKLLTGLMKTPPGQERYGSRPYQSCV